MLPVRRLLLFAVLLLTITPIRAAAAREAYHDPMTREELTDKNGHVYTEREILRYSLDRFENEIYQGLESVAIDVYYDAAIRQKERRFRRLPRQTRHTLEQLDCLLANFDSCMADVGIAYEGGATNQSICFACRRQGAYRQVLLSDLAARWRSLPRHSPADRARFQAKIAAFHKRLQAALQKLPDDNQNQRSELTTLGEEISALEAAVASLPDGAAGHIAARLQSQFPVLDEMMGV